MKPQAVLKLSIQTETEENLAQSEYIPTKISWTKARGHQYIAVGYSNGLVALFFLNNTSYLLKSEDMKELYPFKVFQPHFQVITFLHLYHTSGGNRWLATGSLDRHGKFWDLQNTTCPVSTYKKHVNYGITDGVWLNHWLCAFFGCDDEGSGKNALTFSCFGVTISGCVKVAHRQLYIQRESSAVIPRQFCIRERQSQHLPATIG